MNQNHYPDYGPEEPAGDGYRVPQQEPALPPGLVRADGTVRLGGTISGGFSQLFARYVPWLLLCLVGVAGCVLLAVGVGATTVVSVLGSGVDPEVVDPDDYHLPLGVMIGISAVSILLTAVLTTAAYNGALQVAENRRISFGDFFRFKHGFAVPAVVTALISLPSLVSVSFQYSVESLSVVGIYALVMLLLMFLAPLYQFAPFYALDHGCGIGESFKRCFADGSRNYLSLLGLMILSAVMLTIGALTIIGAFILLPFSGIAYALAFRQMSRGIHVAL